MNVHPGLALRNEQTLQLRPSMLLSIEVLQLATAELGQLISRELETNETLAAEPRESELPVPAAERTPEEHFDPDRWSRPRASDDSDPKMAMLANAPAPAAGLLEHVREQLAWLDLPPAWSAGVELLVESLDERGLLTLPEEDLAQLVGAELLAPCLAVLWTLEPRGLGASSPIEAMLFQLDPADPDYGDIAELLTQHLDDLARNRLPEVARAMRRDVQEIEGLIQRMAKLDPAPGARFRDTAAASVHPDVIVRRTDDGELRVIVDDADLPVLTTDAEYEAMAACSDSSPEVRRYLKTKLGSARDLIHAVASRKQTLARVCVAILERQPDLLRDGLAGVRPLKMADIAEMLELHVSTISRAIAGKYVQTDRGVFRLRDFFDGGGSADAFGRLAVKERLRELVGVEDPRAPLSDDDLVIRLQGEGIKVARRTVTKYRKELGIASSFGRRTFAKGDDR